MPPVFVPSSYTSQLARQPGRVQLLDVGSSFNYIIITAGQQSRYTFALPLPNPRSTRPPPIQHDALKKIPKVPEAGEVSQVDPVPPKNRGYHPRLRSATCASTPTPPHQSKHPETNLPPLQPGRLSSTLWFCGVSLLHTGVVINGREYAYGGHDQRGRTGVYWTKPKTEPPGGTFKSELLHGFTLASAKEIDGIIRDVSDEFLGTSYNLLTKNCNHFTAHLCKKLTGRPGPGWLNRAANIGVVLPCVVPRDWIEAPDFETAEGELLEDEELHGRSDEHSRMLRTSDEQPRLVEQSRRGSDGDEGEWESEEERRRGGSGKGKGKARARDSAGRALPASERAPTT